MLIRGRVKIHIHYLVSATKVGFMPELKWDDKIIVQSNAITRFVVMKFSRWTLWPVFNVRLDLGNVVDLVG